MPDTTLIEVEEALSLTGRDDVVFVDCRFSLDDPRAGLRDYGMGHVPGARHADLERDLSAPRGGGGGRHPLPRRDVLAGVLGRLGIQEGRQVIAYDEGASVYASHFWWLVRWMGHAGVAVLNGGFSHWCEAGGPVSADIPVVAEKRFWPGTPLERAVDTAEVGEIRIDPGQCLIDARGPARFAGTEEQLDRVAGHVPGAVNVPFRGNLAPDGRFLSREALAARFAPFVSGRTAPAITHMCGSGVSACHNLLAMAHAGMPGSRLYAGSWSAWIEDPERPVATGP